jgi:hypothetical protein
VLGEKICAKDRLVDGGPDEWHVRKMAAAERYRFEDLSPGLDVCSIGAGERRTVSC